MLCTTLEQQALGILDHRTVNTQVYIHQRSNKQRHGNIVWQSSHDMTTDDDQYQYGSVGNDASLFQS